MTDLRDQGSATTSTTAEGGAAEQGRAVAQTAAAETRDVADHAKEQVTSLAVETREQAMQALSSATNELETQLTQRLGEAASLARTTADELRALSEGRPQDAGRTAGFVRQASQRLDRFAERTEVLGARGAAEEVADFGRRRPVAFLLGAAAAGVLVGRMVRAGKSAHESEAPRTISSPPEPPFASSSPSSSPASAASLASTPPTVAPMASPEPPVWDAPTTEATMPTGSEMDR
jgi:hypothetical protein